MRTALRRYWPVLLATAVLVPHALRFDFVNDDAYISFRYAKNLAQHGQLVFNPGERVEGFTNFLWTVLLAGVMKLGVSPVLSSRFFGMMFAIGTLAVLVRLSLRLNKERPSPWHAVAPLALAATPAFACWVSGGLETQMFTFLSLLAFDRLLQEIDHGTGAHSALWFALAAMTRPEGMFFFGLAAIYRVGFNLIRDRRIRPQAHEASWVLLFGALFTPYFVWRWRYYGWVFPNTFYVKSSGGTWALGFYYLRRFAEDSAGFFWIPFIVLGWPRRLDRARRAIFGLSAFVAIAFAIYVGKVGGDFMGLYRFVLPVVPLGALLAQESARALCIRLGPFIPRPILAAAAIALLTAQGYANAHVGRQAAEGIPPSDNGIDSPGYLKDYADERVAVGLWFKKYARPDDLMTVGGAGVIPYYSEIPAFDCYGLVDETIAHDKTMVSGHSRPGHQKWVADWYVWKRRPTLITHKYCFCTMNEGVDYYAQNGYEWVTATIPGLRPPGVYSFLKRIDRAFGPFPAHQP